jgi:hypothetical protein
VVTDLIGFANRFDDAQGQRGGAQGLVCPGLNDSELVATKARNGIPYPHAALQAFGGRLQQRVSHRMSQGVVDLLEAIEIQPMHGYGSIAFERILQPFAQKHTIGEVGQRIMVRYVLDARLDAPLLGDVLVRRHAAAVGQRANGVSRRRIREMRWLALLGPRYVCAHSPRARSAP